MKLINLCSFFLLAFLLNACNSQSSIEKINKEVKTVRSWAATAHFVADAWRQNNIPNVYAKQTLQLAQQELQEENKILNKLTILPVQRNLLIKNIDRIKYTVSLIAVAVEQKDRTAIEREIQQLSTEEKQIANFSQTLGEQP